MSCSYQLLKIYKILDSILFQAREQSNTTFLASCIVLNSATKIQKDVLDLCKPLIKDSPRNAVDFVHFLAKV